MLMRIIMLLDMDYFYAACEELRHPELKDRPLVVGSDPKQGKGRGVVMTCNYIARKFGIRSGMPISTAYSLKKDASYLPADFTYYEKISGEVMKTASGFASRFEQVSIDEAYLDVSDRMKNHDQAVKYAEELKESIKKRHGLPCSIGIGPNKLIAKMACEASKPNGIKLVGEGEAREFLAPLPVGKLFGVGRKTAQKLEEMGYRTVADIAKANPMGLVGEFGVFGGELYNHARGMDESEVVINYEVKSIGRERTLEYDTSEREVVVDVMKRISREIIEELKRQGLSFKTVTIKMRYSDFSEHLKSVSLTHHTDDLRDLVDCAIKLFDVYHDRSEEIRKIGVRVSGLVKSRGQKKIQSFIKP